MKNHANLTFFFIVFVSVLSLIVVLPQQIPIALNAHIPLINKEVAINQTIQNVNLSAILGQFGVHKEFVFQRGLDLEGGSSITLQADMTGVEQTQRRDALEATKSVVERRVNALGVSEPLVQTSQAGGEYRVIVELAGITDVNEAIARIGTTAQLSFWEQGATESADTATASASIPQQLLQVFGPTAQKTTLTGKELEDTSVVYDPQTGQPQIQLIFNQEGGKKFADITRRNVGKEIATLLDDQVIQVARVNEPIIGGRAVITGGFTTEQAKAISDLLKEGSLPIPLRVVQQQTIGPTLGIVSLQKSLFAGILGFLVIVLFMIGFYKKLGILASFALILYALYSLAIFKAIPVTLTLAGIAGFILSIGMAVDANILIFERMKEELRRGRPLHMAIELGFARAWTSIRDSNIATLITCFILFQFGTGIIRGFAVTLAIGVLVSMFSAIVVTRTFLRLVYR